MIPRNRNQGRLPYKPLKEVNSDDGQKDKVQKKDATLKQVNTMFSNGKLGNKRKLMDQNNPLALAARKAKTQKQDWSSQSTGSSMSSFGSTKYEAPSNEKVVIRKPPSYELDGKVLNSEQTKILNMCLSGKSLFYTGAAGTGKSFLLHAIIRELRKMHPGRDTVIVTAATGLAAVNIGGTTLHSFAAVGFGKLDSSQMIDRVAKSRKVQDKWRNVKVVIIDEISMINGEFFTVVNRLAKKMKNPDKPFGGVQLIVTGDFFQLPPVIKKEDVGKPAGTFCFETAAWRECIRHKLLLTEVFRQKDMEFIDMLNSMRLGIVTPEIYRRFLQLQRPIKYDDGIEPTYLYSRRDSVKQENETRMNMLPTKPIVFQAIDEPKNGTMPGDLERLFREVAAEKTLMLKIGAQVILNHSVEQGEQRVLPNGLKGVVVSFMTQGFFEAARTAMTKEFLDMYNFMVLKETSIVGQHTQVYEDLSSTMQARITNAASAFEKEGVQAAGLFPVVRFSLPVMSNLQEFYWIKKQEFSVEDAGGKVLASRTQVPLLPSWALSIHRSQGQTLQRVVVDFKSIFEKGQAYVAMSRCVSPDTLEIRNFSSTSISTNPKVREFYEGLTPVATLDYRYT